MLEIQKYLRRPDCSIETLARDYKVAAKRHPQYPNLVLLKYNQIDSPMSERLVQECRGIILDQDDGWNVVSRAFDKFFNHGEGHAAPINWDTARVYEKVDGSLCVLYFYDGLWHVATSGSPNAGGDVHGNRQTFHDLFWETFVGYGAEVPKDRSVCIYFELTGPLNRIVVPHAQTDLTVLGGRHLDGGEFPSEIAAQLVGPQPIDPNLPPIQKIPAVKSFPLQSFHDINASFNTMSPLSQEGYVVCDGDFNRVKVKHPGYVALHHAKDGMTTKAFVEIARSGEVPEVIAAFPEFGPLLAEAKSRVDAFISQIESAYQSFQHIAEQKEFALGVSGHPCSAAMFALRANKVPSLRAYVADMRLETLVKLLGYQDQVETSSAKNTKGSDGAATGVTL